jgi:rhodanese-related sulfurtransferase
MINLIKKILGLQNPIDFKNLVKERARIIDVRTKQEYNNGHINGSINIPLDSLKNNLKSLGDKNAPIITCCASGMRSASAKAILKSLGYTNVYNGGGWHSLKNKIQ